MGTLVAAAASAFLFLAGHHDVPGSVSSSGIVPESTPDVVRTDR